MEGNNSYGHGSSWADQWDTSDPAAPTTVSNKKKAAAVAQPRSTSRSLRCLMMAAIIMDAIAMAMPIPIRCSSDGGLGSPFVSLVYKGTVSLSYNKMNTDVLMMSNVNILAGGIWKFETVVSMSRQPRIPGLWPHKSSCKMSYLIAFLPHPPRRTDRLQMHQAQAKGFIA
ncbi:hypothetical protein V6N11_067063 [Hibiscus sabdariffa]|uniref:Uncharacterized protein n=1 Tax=Hibiscus sabdariffa TaxID=183260 RepID=A0ABR2SQ03_9ROSI